MIRLGRLHTVNLSFTAGPANHWTAQIDVPDDVNGTTRGTVALNFGAGASPAVPDGTMGAFGATTGSIGVPAGSAAGDPAALTFTADFGEGAQTVTLSLGAFGTAAGLTQYAGTEFAVRNLAQDGVPLGSFAGLAMRANGDVAVDYDNGQSRVIARIPLVAFNDPEKLQRLDGQAFMRTPNPARRG